MGEIVLFSPAKINFSLLVRSVDANGYHPLRSLTQALAWGDTLEFQSEDEDALEIEGADDLPTDGSNLVWKAISALGGSRPRLHIRLRKQIPSAAGMGGGSSNAAAALRAMQEFCRLPDDEIRQVAPRIGADVPFFLTGGTAWMEGYGERITRLDPLTGFAVGVAVPSFELSTPEVFRRWDRMGEPVGDEIPGRRLPPQLRDMGPIRNDLTPAAISLRPDLGDWMRDLSERWERPVALSGSGPTVYSWFADHEEAESAVAEAPGDVRCRVAARLSPAGIERLE